MGQYGSEVYGKGVWNMEIYCVLCRWVWTEGGQNPELEQELDVGGFGYPVSNLLALVGGAVALDLVIVII